MGVATVSDEINVNPPPEQADSGDSASDIFAAIMREAAERAKPKSAKSAKSTIESAGAGAADDSSQQRTEPADEGESLAAEAVAADEQADPPEQPMHFFRVRPRAVQRHRGDYGFFGGFLYTIFVVLIIAGLVATVLTWFTDPQSLNPAVVKGLQLSDAVLMASLASADATPTPVATPNWHYRIGIISGHRGAGQRGNDPGAICSDEYDNVTLREADINFAVAQRVVAMLKSENFSVDLLDELDPRLDNYQATALVSIHANSCQDYGRVVSGYIVAKAEARPDYGNDTLLRECIALNYGALVPLERSFLMTTDMTDNHMYRSIHPLTPAVLLELGYMLADREVLVEQQELLAQAIINGIDCYLGVSGNVSSLSPNRPDRRYLVPLLVTPTPEW